MTFVIAGIFGLGGPEVVAIMMLALMLVGGSVLFIRLAGGRTGINRYCPHCGRGLTQQMDAPLCSYCGQRLP